MIEKKNSTEKKTTTDEVRTIVCLVLPPHPTTYLSRELPAEVNASRFYRRSAVASHTTCELTSQCGIASPSHGQPWHASLVT